VYQVYSSKKIEYENIKNSSSTSSLAICLYYEKFGFASFEGGAERGFWQALGFHNMP
jgi:hypothetical protein